MQLAPQGPDRASRAIAILNRQIEFQRRLSFHPRYDAALQKVIDQMPPRQATMIRAAALYSKPTVPWIALPDGTHRICVAGHPDDTDYLYTLAKEYRSPEEPARFSGVFGLKPSADSTDGNISSVTGTLAGELLIDTYGLGALVDVFAGLLRECYGDLKGPWDTAPGVFNRHDHAAMDRFHRQMPHLAEKFDRYFKFNNIVDEFNSPSGTIVILNVDAEMHQEALKKYPQLYEFYRKVVPAVTTDSTIMDSHNNYWTRIGFDHGHIRVTLMVRNGQLTPFNAALKPAGDSVAVDAIEHGTYHTVSSVKITSLAMNFGLANVGFATDYSRDANATTFTNHMDAVPELVAPPGIHQMMDLIAGEFLRVLATSNGGMTSKLGSRRLSNGNYEFAGGFTAQLNYSPTLELLARVGDTVAKEHNQEVRTEERAFFEELFDAFVADYNDARPAILALDHEQDHAHQQAARK